MEMTHANTANCLPIGARVVVIVTSCSPSPAYPAQGGKRHAGRFSRTFAGTFVSANLWITLKKWVGVVDFHGRSPVARGLPTRFASIEREPTCSAI
jgi:hypothetical protein